MSDALEQQVRTLQEELAALRQQVTDPDLKAFEQIRDLRATNKKLTEEVKRLTSECVQLAFKGRQTETELRKTNVLLDAARAEQANLGHSIEDLQGELGQSREHVLQQEANFERQRLILVEHQRQVSELNSEVEQRASKISTLEQLVDNLKEQYLSGEFTGMVIDEASPPVGEAFRILATHLEQTLGFSGRTMVEQVFELSGVSFDTTDAERLEEVFEALQDTGLQLLRGTDSEKDFAATLELAWAAVQAQLGQGPGVEDTQAAAVHGLVLPTAAEETHEEPVHDEHAEPDFVRVEENHTEPELVEETHADPEHLEELPTESAHQEEAHAEQETHPEPAPVEEIAEHLEEKQAEPEPIDESHAVPEFVEETHAAPEPALESIPEAGETEKDWAQAESVPVTPEEHDALVGSEPAGPGPGHQKQQLIAQGIALASTEPARAQTLLESALEDDRWVDEQARAELTLARIKAGQDDIAGHLVESMLWLVISDLFQPLSAAEAQNAGIAPLTKVLEALGSQPRAQALASEAAAGYGAKSMNRSMIAEIDTEDEESLMEVFVDQLVPKAGLDLPSPSTRFTQLREQASPAAFVGTLRQALRGVDYIAFDFQQLDVLMYDGPEKFLVEAALEPNFTLMFHRDIEGMPPEELRFLVYCRLAEMYRGYTRVQHMADGFTDESRLALTRAFLGVFEAENDEVEPALRAQLDAIQPGQADFKTRLNTWYRNFYDETLSEISLDLADWIYDDKLLERRLKPFAAQFASRIVGLTTASYASVREGLLHSTNPEQLAELEKTGLQPLFEKLDEAPDSVPAALQVQRLWSGLLADKL